jgi:hypothetical protein
MAFFTDRPGLSLDIHSLQGVSTFHNLVEVLAEKPNCSSGRGHMRSQITSERFDLVFLPSRFTQCSHLFLALLLTLAACLLGSGPAQGQATTSIRGTVTDPGANAVVGADVVLADAESKTERTVKSGNQGEYQFLLIPPGTYTLTVTAPGFRRYEQKGLALLVNTPATTNIQLIIGSRTEVVTVTAEAPTLVLAQE